MATTQKTQSRFLEIIKEYWLVLLALLFAIPLIVKYFQKADANNLSAEAEAEVIKLKAENSDPVKQQQNANAISTNSGYQKIAHDVAYHFGVNFPWYSPLFWTENDTAVFNLLKTLNSGQLKVVGALYNKVYAVGRILKDDCQRYLPTDDYNQLHF